MASTDAHPDADDVFRIVRERISTISLDTVYRTLGTLTDLGPVNRVVGVKGAARFDANTAHRRHFACSRCGRIDELRAPVLTGSGFRGPRARTATSTVEVRFSGVCHECATGSRS